MIYRKQHNAGNLLWKPFPRYCSKQIVVSILLHLMLWSQKYTTKRGLYIYDMPRYRIFIIHYIDVIMTTVASQITSLAVVYSSVYLDANQRKHQSSASLAFVWGIHRDRWIPRTKGQLRGKCFHLMTSSWYQWQKMILMSLLSISP